MGRLYLDVSDLALHAIWSGRCTGIQRVQIELTTHFIAQSDARAFCVLGNKWTDLSELFKESGAASDALFETLQKKFGYLHPSKLYTGLRSRFRRSLIDRRGRTRVGVSGVPRLDSDDVFFFGGSFWAVAPSMSLLEHAIRLGLSTVAIVYDLIAVRHEDIASASHAKEFRRFFALPVDLIAISQATRKEILDELAAAHLPSVRRCSVAVAPLAHEYVGTPRNQITSRRTGRLATICKDRPFVLYVSTVEIRKNHMRLMAVWEQLAAEIGSDLPLLVIAGRRGWKAEETWAKLDTESECIAFFEAPDDNELRELYGACLFTVFPSLLEGWGLPVGESLWFGKACAASNVSSIPEVGGDLCRYFDPKDSDDMKVALRALLDPDIRKTYETRIRQAPLRSWADVTRDLTQIIEACVSEKVACTPNEQAKGDSGNVRAGI